MQLRIRCSLKPGYRMRPLNLKVQHRDSSVDTLPAVGSYRYVAIRKVSSVTVAFRRCLLQRGHLALNLLLKEKYHCLLILLELKMNSELALI